MARHLDFNNAFPSKNLEQPTYSELPPNTFSEEIIIVKRRGRLNEPRDAVKLWDDFLLKTISKLGLRDLESSSSVFISRGAMVNCYPDSLTVFVEMTNLDSLWRTGYVANSRQ